MMSSESLLDSMSMSMDIPMISSIQDISESIDEDFLNMLPDLDASATSTTLPPDLEKLGFSFSSIVQDDDDFLESVMRDEVLCHSPVTVVDMTRPVTPEQSPRSASPAPTEDSDAETELKEGLKRLFRTMQETNESRKSVKRQRCLVEKSAEDFFLSPRLSKIEESRQQLIKSFEAQLQ